MKLPEGILHTGNDTAYSPLASQGELVPGEKYKVPARQARAVRLRAGQALKLVNVFGTQVADCWAFNADDLTECLSMEHVRADLQKLAPRAGDRLVSNRRRTLLTLEEDSSPGIHDTLIAACDEARYRLLGVKRYHDNCADNLCMALHALGLEAPKVPAPLNLWMNIPTDAAGQLSWLPTVARPGDYVVLRAAIPAMVVISACPQDLVPINGEDCTPRDLELTVID